MRGRAIIAQADERIRWHKQTATKFDVELKTLKSTAGASPSLADDWKLTARRSDLESKRDAHLEYARFLNFVRQNVVRERRYILSLQDLSFLEIMPKGRYW